MGQMDEMSARFVHRNPIRRVRLKEDPLPRKTMSMKQARSRGFGFEKGEFRQPKLRVGQAKSLAGMEMRRTSVIGSRGLKECLACNSRLMFFLAGSRRCCPSGARQ